MEYSRAVLVVARLNLLLLQKTRSSIFAAIARASPAYIYACMTLFASARLDILLR